jgi:hypothetical protein
MTCGRCQGLLLATWLWDQEVQLLAWRCATCGNLVDETILRHRTHPVEPLSHASDYHVPLRLSR